MAASTSAVNAPNAANAFEGRVLRRRKSRKVLRK